jgi:hypothetical protein
MPVATRQLSISVHRVPDMRPTRGVLHNSADLTVDQWLVHRVSSPLEAQFGPSSLAKRKRGRHRRLNSDKRMTAIVLHAFKCRYVS